MTIEITLSGIPTLTTQLAKILNDQSGVEAAFLLSLSNWSNRYPPLSDIFDGIQALERSAVHVCGRLARQLIKEKSFIRALQPAGRIQINGRITRLELEEIMDLYPGHPVITQMGEAVTIQELGLLAASNKWLGHHILLDVSGGNGLKRDRWTFPKTEKHLGMAGGLADPADDYRNLRIALQAAADAGLGVIWVDAENHLRNVADEWVTEKALNFIEAVRRIQKAIELKTKV